MNCCATEGLFETSPPANLSGFVNLLSLDPAPCPPHLLVIAYGNSLRRDDGAGIALAEQIVACWQAQKVAVHLRTVTQLAPELAVELAVEGLAAVFFVDAAILTDQSAIQIQPIQVEPATPALGHQCSPATLLLYATLLYQRTPPAWLVTLPGVDFGHGEGFSPTVGRLLTTAPLVADQLLAVLKRMLPRVTV